MWGNEQTIIVFIHYAVEDYAQRKLIRQNWDANQYFDIYPIKQVFILAMSNVEVQYKFSVVFINIPL